MQRNVTNREDVECCEENRWQFYQKESEISLKAKQAWEVGRKLGLHSKCSEEPPGIDREETQRHIKEREKEDMQRRKQGLSMKIISFNVRGLGKRVKKKKKKILDMVFKNKIDMCCI